MNKVTGERWDTKRIAHGTVAFRGPLRHLSPLAWAKSLPGWALFLFFTGATVLHGPHQQQILALILGFGLLVAHGTKRATARLFPFPPELMCYTAWVFWAGVTGPLVAASLQSFWSTYRVVLEVCAVVWVVYGIVRLRETSASGLLLGIVAGGMIEAGTVLFGGLPIFGTTFQDDRAAGTSGNANVLGANVVLCLLCAFMFWGVAGRTRKWVRPGLLALIPFGALAIIASASRKAVLALLLLIGWWGVWASSLRRDLRGQVFRGATLALIGGVVLLLFPLVMRDTTLGQRFQYFTKKGEGSLELAVEENIRYTMYVEGLKMFVYNPMFGVGMGNFQVHFYTGQYSHSDYIEPLANTGLPGFLLYQSFYVLVLGRALRLLKRVRDPFVNYRLKLIVMTISTIMMLGIGAPWQTSPVIFALLTVFSVFTNDVGVALRWHARAAAQGPFRRPAASGFQRAYPQALRRHA